MRRMWTRLAVSLVVGAWPFAGAVAQTPPAGNAHPELQALSEVSEGIGNPFGVPSRGSSATPQDKQAFAEGVDLEPLRGLAVFHDGRVKILDTLARETVRRITGRKDYFDVSADGGKLRYDPLFTLLDLMIDPWYYADRPLIGVEYLPLRRAFIESTAQNPAQRDRALRLGRLSPMTIAALGDRLEEKYAFELPYRKAFDRIHLAMRLVDGSWANLMMVAPPSSEQPYGHLSSLPAGSPARRAAASIGEAWRKGDAGAVNSAIRTLAAELPKINADQYPQGRRSLELTYNRANAFEYGYWAYLGALVALIIAFGTGRRWLIALGIATLVLAVGLHAFGFVARCFIAERFAIQNQFESMTGVSLFANIMGLGIMLAKRQWLYGAAAAGTGFMILITATQTGIPGGTIEREAAILNTSVLLKYHVTTVLSSYGLISLGFITSLFYLGTYYGAKLRRSESPGELAASSPLATAALNAPDGEPRGLQKTLGDLDKAQMTVLQLAFWTLGVGLLLGAWWADHSWGRWWAFDPKETWALATWIIYLIVIHVRFTTGRNRGLVTAWLSVLGFFVMLWTYFGVNLLLPGLHAYA